MVHTRNGSNYSVQQDVCGQRRGKTKSRSAKSSSRKTHLEDARVSPHSPRSLPTDFDVKSEPELIHDNISRAEPFSSGRNRNISMPITKLVQSSQRRGVGNMPKPLAGGHELYLHIKNLLGQEKTIELLGEEPKSFIHRPEERVGNDSSFGDRGPSGVYQLQTSSRSVQGQPQRTSEEPERSQEPSRQRQIQSQLAQTLPTRAQNSQIGAFSHGQYIQHGQRFNGIHSQRAGKDEQNLSKEIIDQIHFVQSNIDVALGKFEPKINKLTSDISELKINDKNYTEWYQVVNVRIDSIVNTCNRIENTLQVQNDQMEYLSIFIMNDQHNILKDHVFKIVENTDQFATHLAKSDSERQKLKTEIIANVEQIHKNYLPHIPRHSPPLTEEKLSVKGCLTPFLGENVISAMVIPKLEEWPAFSGEGEYNHIDFIRTIDMLQEDFHIPDEIIVRKLHSLFTRTAKKWHHKMRMDHGKHDWSWWKSEVITQWANNSWRFKI
ncbi:hypothetical protein O181_101345 [Austropuccinia psidii MF-1]|uniref:Uncharacterized protein n=1 Tax=Austropuccinia psidii MF-1 TaxID=1389203 RepID=A0A9Q3JE99_9BASI|nr:hypothetical protein [Austropuccinia psidii MF-1]